MDVNWVYRGEPLRGSVLNIAQGLSCERTGANVGAAFPATRNPSGWSLRSIMMHILDSLTNRQSQKD